MGIILPSKKFTIESSKPLGEVRAQLKAMTQESKGFGTEPGTFIGKVEEGSFSIYPQPRGRNSFAPTITGEFTETAAGCVTTVKMSLSPIIKLFEMICCIELIPLLFISLLYAVAEGNVIFLSITVLFIALSQALVRLSFYFPARSAERRLRAILS